MPFGWIDPDVFMTYRDVTIYHVYRHDDYDEGVREYYYTTDIHGGDSDAPCSFDVRELSTYADELSHEEIIRRAIELNELEMPD